MDTRVCCCRCKSHALPNLSVCTTAVGAGECHRAYNCIIQMPSNTLYRNWSLRGMPCKSWVDTSDRLGLRFVFYRVSETIANWAKSPLKSHNRRYNPGVNLYPSELCYVVITPACCSNKGLISPNVSCTARADVYSQFNNTYLVRQQQYAVLIDVNRCSRLFDNVSLRPLYLQARCFFVHRW